MYARAYSGSAGCGIDSFKIEGRMKTALYVATVARTYRKAIDDCLESKKIPRQYGLNHREISRCTYRQSLQRAFITESRMKNLRFMILIPIKVMQFIWALFTRRIIRAVQRIEQRNKFCVGDVIEIMKPDGRNVACQVLQIQDDQGGKNGECATSEAGAVADAF